ncbi:unnamed protein product [Effrenium voratum]|nr:unnamed protein product [Effrenium voratum]
MGKAMEDDQALCVGCEQPLVEEDGANAEKDKQKKAVKVRGLCQKCALKHRALCAKSGDQEVLQWFNTLKDSDGPEYRKVLAAAEPHPGQRYSKFNLTSYREEKTQKKQRGEREEEEAMSWTRYLAFHTEDLALPDRMSASEARAAWLRDPKERIPVFVRKLNRWEERDHVWVATKGRKRWKAKLDEDSRTACRAHQSQTGSEQAAASVLGRLGNFVTFGDDNDDFFKSWLAGFGADDSQFVAAGHQDSAANKGRNKTRSSKAAGKEAKLVDVNFLRTQALSKLVSQVKFVTAAHLELHDTFKQLSGKGVDESRILSDQTLGLDDMAGTVKCMYALDRRLRAVQILKMTEPESVEQMSEKFAELCNEDGYLQENASKAATVAFLQWLGFNPAGAGKTDHFDDCMVKDQVDGRLKEILEKATAAKTVAQSLRRAIKDIQNMTKALQKARAAFEAKRKELENSSANGTLTLAANWNGRTNFAKCISDSDPLVLRCFKGLAGLRPMKVITAKSPALEEGALSFNQALIIRKGRHSFQTITKDFKEEMEASVNEFKERLSRQADARSATLKRARISNDDANAAMRDRFHTVMPLPWQENATDHNELGSQVLAKGQLETQQMMQGRRDFDAVWLVGQKDKAVHAGLEASGVGNIRLCVYGGLLVVTADLAECAAYFGTQSIPDIKEALLATELHSVPDGLSLPSLSAGYVKTGDFLAMPMGTVVVSKSINGDHVGLRRNWMQATVFPENALRAFRAMVAEQVVSKPMMLYAMEAAPEVAKAALEDAEQAVGEDGTSDVDPFEAELSEMLDSQKGPLTSLDKSPRSHSVRQLCSSQSTSLCQLTVQGSGEQSGQAPLQPPAEMPAGSGEQSGQAPLQPPAEMPMQVDAGSGEQSGQTPLQPPAEMPMQVDAGTPLQPPAEMPMQVDAGTPLPAEMPMQVDAGTPLQPPAEMPMQVDAVSGDQSGQPPLQPAPEPAVETPMQVDAGSGDQQTFGGSSDQPEPQPLQAAPTRVEGPVSSGNSWEPAAVQTLAVQEQQDLQQHLAVEVGTNVPTVEPPLPKAPAPVPIEAVAADVAATHAARPAPAPKAKSAVRKRAAQQKVAEGQQSLSALFQQEQKKRKGDK